MKITIGLILLALSSASFAGDYSDAANNLRVCENSGDIAAMVYGTKNKKSKSSVMKVAMSRNYQDEKIRKMTIFNVNYAYDSAISEKDAYRAAWANCMDMM